MEKACSKCKISKLYSCFNNDKRYKDGKYPSCKLCKDIVRKSYYIKNKDKIIKKNIERISLKRQDKSFREKEKVWIKNYSKGNPRKTYHAEYNRKRRKTDINFKLASNLRTRLYCCIRDNAKMGSAVCDLGCTVTELKKHLESQFQENMSWNNYGRYGWHIDHIIPLDAFDLSDQGQFKKACHYTNLQPLWAEDNLSKGSKVPL